MPNLYSCHFGKHLTLAEKDEAWVSHEAAVPIPGMDPKETQVTVSTAGLLKPALNVEHTNVHPQNEQRNCDIALQWNTTQQRTGVAFRYSWNGWTSPVILVTWKRNQRKKEHPQKDSTYKKIKNRQTSIIFVGKHHRCWRGQWHPAPVLLPGKSHGRRSLVGCRPWGREESDTEGLHFHFSL